jgi:uncharacterized delta-60 repeat protein
MLIGSTQVPSPSNVYPIRIGGSGMRQVGDRLYVSGYVQRFFQQPQAYIRSSALSLRLFPTGDIDATYGKGGFVLGPDCASSPAPNGVFSADGRFAGTCTGTPSAYIVGTLVPANGSGDVQQAGFLFLVSSGGFPASVPHAIALDASGNAVYAGAYTRPDGLPGMAVIKKDTRPSSPFATIQAFAGGGRGVDFGVGPVAQRATRVTVDALDRVLVAGLVGPVTAPTQIGIARLLPNGELDAGFGGGGLVLVPLGGLSDLVGLAVDSAGRVVFVANYLTSSQLLGTDISVGRLLGDGSLDTGFGGQGTGRARLGFNFASPYNDYATSVLIQPDDKILVAGYGTRESTNERNAFALARLNTDGSLDASFGGNGRVQGTFAQTGPTASTDEFALGLALDSRNRLMVVGESYAPGGLPTGMVAQMGLARITTGLLPPDPVFANGFE